jgi:hypothetical protein
MFMDGESSEAIVADVADALDYVDRAAAIAAAIADSPIDEIAIRRGVWMYVSGARGTRRTPREVVVALTALVEDAMVAPVSVRRALSDRVVRWCVEAYFGQLGGDLREQH